MLLLRRGLRDRPRRRVRRRRAAGVARGARGDKSHPANAGRLCTKGATSADMLAAGGRATHALVRAERGAEPVRADRRRGDRSTRPAPARGPRRARARRVRALRLRPDDAWRRSTWPTSSPRASSARNQIESNSRLCMASAGTRLQAVARRGRAARVLRRLRPRRRVPRHRREHGRLPPDPVPADDRPGQGRAPSSSSSTPAAPPPPTRPTCSSRSRRAPTSRCSTACCTCSSRRARSTRSSSPSTPRAGTSSRPSLGGLPARRGRAHHRHRRGRPAHRGRDASAGPTNWMSCWTMGLNQSTHGTWNTNALVNLHLATGAICRTGSGPVLADRPAQRDGRPRDGLHGSRACRASARCSTPTTARSSRTSGASPPGTLRTEVPAAAPSTCSSGWPPGEIKACWIICTNPVASVGNRAHRDRRARGRRARRSTQDAFAETETNAYADVVLPARAVGGVRRRDDQLRAQPHARAAAARPAGRGAARLAAHRAGRVRDGVRDGVQLRLVRGGVRRAPRVLRTRRPATTCAA